MRLVKQAAACEIAVPSGIERDGWFTGNRAHYCTTAGWITVVHMTCCILMELVLLWWKIERVADKVSNATRRAIVAKTPCWES